MKLVAWLVIVSFAAALVLLIVGIVVSGSSGATMTGIAIGLGLAATILLRIVRRRASARGDQNVAQEN
jgi:hypothetical protein